MQKFRKLTDDQLVSAFAAGDNQAFDALLGRHETRLYNYILRVIRDEDLANDFFQETFVKVITTIKQGRYTPDGKFADNVIYFGPMGCRTGFYFLVRDMSNEDALQLIKDTIKQCAEHKGEIPGTTAIECGNYLEHDLDGALKELNKYYSLLKDYTVDNLQYN